MTMTRKEKYVRKTSKSANLCVYTYYVLFVYTNIFSSCIAMSIVIVGVRMGGCFMGNKKKIKEPIPKKVV